MERIYLKLYNPSDIYMAPSSEVMDAVNVLAHFPGAQTFTHIVQTDEGNEMMYGLYSLSAMRSKYNIDKNLNDEEATQAIEDAMNEEREEEESSMGIPTPEERIAAALEFQTLTSLPDAEEEE